jgi:hypothetical protein
MKPAYVPFVLVGLLGLGLALAIGGCGRSPASEVETVRASVPFQELQAWAVDMLRSYPSGTNALVYGFGPRNYEDYRGYCVLSNPPAFLGKIPTFGAVGPMIRVSGRGSESERSVDLTFFYGGWGGGQIISVGGAAYVTPTNSSCFCLAPGVYYTVR